MFNRLFVNKPSNVGHYHKSMPSNSHNPGFTLIELMVTVAIAGVVLSIGIPSFNSTLRNNRLTTYSNELITALNLAKSEAIKRGLSVVVRKKGSTAGQWHEGWEVFVDSDANTTFNDNGNSTLCEINADGSPKEDCLLRVFDALANGFTLNTSRDYMGYKATGMSDAGTAIDFNLCQGMDASHSRKIEINVIGRTSVLSPATSCS